MNINIHKLLLTSVLIVSAAVSLSASAAVEFAAESRLASGKWVKVTTAATGIYGISYSDLRKMGFDSPEKVAVYGTGRNMRPDNFTDAAGRRLYDDDLPPAVTMHANDCIYFFAQGPETIEWKTGADPSTEPFFTRRNFNIYSDGAAYFLSQGRSDARIVRKPQAPEATGASETTLYDYLYHERDLQHNYNASGQLFFGESFLPQNSRTMTETYSLPLAVLDAPASMECVFYERSSRAGGKLTYGFGTAAGASATATLPGLATEYDTYCQASPSAAMLTLPGAEGSISIRYSPAATPQGANLDYWLVGYKKRAGRQSGELQWRGFVGRGGLAPGTYSMSDTPPTATVWRVASSADAAVLPAGNGVFSTDEQLPEGTRLWAFDTAEPQLAVTGWSPVANQNLHAMSTPDLVIITTADAEDVASRLAEINKAYDGSEVAWARSEEIFNEFSEGVPDPMAYRTFVKMLYDRNPSRLRNVLLLGLQNGNVRRVGIEPSARESLIAYQTVESNRYESTYGVNDIHGMMADNTPENQSGAYIYRRTQELGVASLPVRSEDDARNLLRKIARYMADESFPYWLSNIGVQGDYGDNDMHASYADDIAVRVSAYTDKAVSADKIFLNNYKFREACDYFRRSLERGSLFSVYFGHGGVQNIGSGNSLFGGADVASLNNLRMPFMGFAGCAITNLDHQVRGMAESMLFSSEGGLIGGLMTTRTAWSNHNKAFMDIVSQAMFSAEEAQEYSRTIGEIYARTKTLSRSANEFVYHLIGYPAVRLPLATLRCTIDEIEGEGVTQSGDTFILIPGTRVKVRGSVTDLKNEKADWSARGVLKVFGAPEVRPLQHLKASSNKAPEFEYDDVVAMTEFDITGGSFETEITVPQLTSGAEAYPSLRLAAYDKDSRRAAWGYCAFGIASSPASGTSGRQPDTAAPAITEMYVDSPDNTVAFSTGNTTVYAVVTDDSGIRCGAPGMDGGTTAWIDGRPLGDITSRATVTEGGRRMELAIPLLRPTYGQHTLRLDAYDYAGNVSTRSIDFTVGAPEIPVSLVLTEAALIDKATFNAEGIPSGSEATLYVADRLGRTVFSGSVASGSLSWNGRDKSGVRLPDGLYTAYVKGRLTDGRVFTSAPIDVALLQ